MKRMPGKHNKRLHRTNFRGGCLCKAVRYETTADPLNQRVCHCRECQKAIEAAFNARVLMRIEDVSITGPISTFYSSDTLERGSCSHCGSSIFSRRVSAGVIGLTVGSLDQPSLFNPDAFLGILKATVDRDWRRTPPVSRRAAV